MAQVEGRLAYLLEAIVTTLQAYDPLVDGYLDGNPARVIDQPSKTGIPDAELFVNVELVDKNESRMGPVGNRVRAGFQVAVVASQPYWESHGRLHLYDVADTVAEALDGGIAPGVVPIGGANGPGEIQVGGGEDDDIVGHVTLPQRFRYQTRGV
ncbi:hypothetical protein SAMN04487947_1222 [Halogeometricum rufum]|uniref:Uncharacterized protein n=1 Tax=Halogeometricum rufum TaxID=553469 RepID=A0A1I6GIT9_9EURY|nr:hypothetical protein [Halogeometricum rufum]SFR42088.1 hypothetical protein SAMN04487947_1222 [Halogeometricum rufum]